MPEQADTGAWTRLGELLERRRVEIDPRYKNLSLFCRERQIDHRLCWDLEHAARVNYRRPTLTAVEVAYGWQPGSVRRVLGGGDPLPVPQRPAGDPEFTGTLKAFREAAELWAQQQDSRRSGSG